MMVTQLASKHGSSVRVWGMIAEAKWSELRQLLVEERRIGMLPSPKQRRYHRDASCRVALLPYCLASRAPEDIVRVILQVEEHRQILSIPDKLGRLPLHIACRHYACQLLIADLITAYPRATVIQDKDGNLPLHYAVQAACSSQPTTLKTKPQKTSAKKTSPASSSSETSCTSVTTSLTDDSTKGRDRLQTVNDLLVTAPTSVLVVNNELETPLSLAIRLENGYNGPSEQTPAYNLMSSVASTVMHDWERQQKLTENRINEMTGFYDESYLERRKPPILSTSSVVKHFLLGR